MPEVLTRSVTIFCPHGGQAILSSSQSDIFVDRQQVLIQSDVHKIVFCPPDSSRPSCVKIKWSRGSQYLKNREIRFLTKSSRGFCYDNGMIFRGYAKILSTQKKVLTNG
jgi:hypothetical protein